MRLIVPGVATTFSVIEVVPAVPAEAPTAEAPVDEAFGKPLSQLSLDVQQTLLAKLPSSAGGLVVGPESNQD